MLDGMRTHRWLPWAILALLLVLLLCNTWFGPDIWYHLYLGGRIAQTFQPQPPDHLFLRQPGFVNFYWLFQLIVRGAYAVGGIHGVSFLFIGVWACALIVWLITVGAFRAGAWGPPLALFALIVCQTRFEQRPEIFSFLFLALEIRWLAAWKLEEAPSWRTFACFALLQAVWCNMHGYFIFGPALVALRIAGWLPNCRKDDRSELQPGWLALWALLGLMLVASVASPFGLRNWQEVALLGNFLSLMHFRISEFLPPTGGPPLRLWPVKLFWCYWGCVAAGGIYVAATAARRELFALLLAATGLYLSAGAFRNIPLVVFFSAPLVGSLLFKLARIRIPERTAAAAFCAAGLAFCVWVVTDGFYRSTNSPSAFGIAESEYAYPTRFAEYLRATGFHGSIFNQSSDGGYLEFHFPDLRFYADSRFVDTPLVRGYFTAFSDPRAFRVLQRRFAFDAALLPIITCRPVIAALLRAPDWRLAYADLHRAFFVNLRSPVGAAAPVFPPQFYRGEDLSHPEFGNAAVEWVSLFAEIDDREHLVQVLTQLEQAPRVPLGVFELALDYARKSSAPEILAIVRTLRPKLIANRPRDGEDIDWLLRQPQ
jgi:hypothetical protein